MSESKYLLYCLYKGVLSTSQRASSFSKYCNFFFFSFFWAIFAFLDLDPDPQTQLNPNPIRSSPDPLHFQIKIPKPLQLKRLLYLGFASALSQRSSFSCSLFRLLSLALSRPPLSSSPTARILATLTKSLLRQERKPHTIWCICLQSAKSECIMFSRFLFHMLIVTTG